MPRACELRAAHAVLIDEQSELARRVATEKRGFSPDEQVRSDVVFKEAKLLAETISSIERFEAGERMTESDRKRAGAPLPHEIEEHRGGKYKYSMGRAAICLSEKRAVDGLEGECSQEISKRIGKNPLGFYMPTNVRMRWESHPNFRVGGERLINTSQIERRIDDTTAGAGAVLTRWDTTWIEFLRAKQVLNQLGVTYMTEMHGNFALPRQSGIGSVTWVAESTSVASTAQTIDQVVFTPKTVGAYTDQSRRFLEQLSIDPELFVRDDLSSILARGIESAVYNGTGSPQPTGILQAAGITQIVALGTNGGSPSYQAAVDLEEQLGKANADVGNMAYLTTAAGKATCKMTPKQGVSQTTYVPEFLWEKGGIINEYPAYSTNLVPSNLTKGSGSSLSAWIFANWKEAMIAFWSGMDVLVDPYTGGPAGTIRIVVLQDCDVEFRHFPSFAYCNDMVTT
jgi:HK97 family phage major capsid protein